MREAARRAEAERYLRTSGAKLRFWLLCTLVFPIANALVWLGIVAVWGASGGLPDEAAVIPILVVVAAEALLLRRLARIFAPHRDASWVVLGMLVVVGVSLLAWGALVFGWLITHPQGD